MKRLKSEKVGICYSQSFKKQNSMKILSILSKLMKPLPWGGVWGGCLLSKLMKPLPWGGVWGGCRVILAVFLLTLASCSGGDDDAPRLVLGEKHTVSLFLSVPAVPGDGSRIGDPGEAVGEGEDWDKMAIMIVYADGQTVPDPVDVRYLSIEDFTSLPDAGNGYKRYSLDVYEGDIYIYGVTYTEKCGQHVYTGYSRSLEAAINACATKDDVEALTISNEYAEGEDNYVGKFLSVASGFYTEDGTKPAAFDVKAVTEWNPDDMPRLILLRLAAKIDIQWDAADAYDRSYTNVKVNSLTYYYNKDASGSDGIIENTRGLLFPISGNKVEKADSKKTFYNTTEISKRNGRVYHYAFPNGMSPELFFNVTGVNDGETKQIDCRYEFSEKLHRATWYKLNVTIRGVTKNIEEKIEFQGPDDYGYPEYE